MVFEVHQSTIKCWRRCKRQFYYKYTLGLEKRRKSIPLVRGTIVHNMIEAVAEGKSPWAVLDETRQSFEEMFAEEREHYGNLLDDIKTIMSGYFDWYKRDPIKPVKINKKNAEHEFEFNLTPSIVMAGKIDLVGVDKRDHNWLVDHKTHKFLPRGDIKYGDIQSAIYIRAVEAIAPAVKIYGIIWNYLRWKVPTVPSLLKNGEMSRKQIDTTWGVYRDALKEAGLDPADYQDMREKLEDREGEFFVRHMLPKNDYLIDQLMEEAAITAREIKRKGGHDRTRTIDRHCEWCDFLTLCQAEMRGLDTEFMLKHDFKEKSKDARPIEPEAEDD